MIDVDRASLPRRTAWRLALVTAALAALVGAPATVASAAPGPVVAAVSELDQVRSQVLADTNSARASAGLAPLVENPDLDGVAQGCSQQQAAANTMAHCDGFASRYPAGWRWAGENVAMGYRADAVVTAWMNSSGHRANILRADATHIGIGFARAANGTMYWTQNFASYPGGDPSTPMPVPESPDTLVPGQVMPSGSSLASLDGAFSLVMQPDGNLVLSTADGRPLWDSGTGGSARSSAVMQRDGNLVVVSAGGTPLWSSRTSGRPGAYLQVQGDGNAVVYSNLGRTPLWASSQQGRSYPWQYALVSGDTLAPGEFLYAGRWRAVMQADGNFVLYDRDRAVWSSNTSGLPGLGITMQTDGNLVGYHSDRGRPSRPVWHTRTGGNGVSELRLQADGNLVVYRADGRPTWWRTRDTSVNLVAAG